MSEIWASDHKIQTLGPHTGHVVSTIALCDSVKTAEAIHDAFKAQEANQALIRDLVEALESASDQLALVHDDAFKQAAGYGLVTSDGRDFSCFQLNNCSTAATKALAALSRAREAGFGEPSASDLANHIIEQKLASIDASSERIKANQDAFDKAKTGGEAGFGGGV